LCPPPSLLQSVSGFVVISAAPTLLLEWDEDDLECQSCLFNHVPSWHQNTCTDASTQCENGKQQLIIMIHINHYTLTISWLKSAQIITMAQSSMFIMGTEWKDALIRKWQKYLTNFSILN